MCIGPLHTIQLAMCLTISKMAEERKRRLPTYIAEEALQLLFDSKFTNDSDSKGGEDSDAEYCPTYCNSRTDTGDSDSHTELHSDSGNVI